MKERLGYIDAIKGVAIFLMVMGHVLAWSYEDFFAVRDDGPFSATLWWRVIYSFHMPLFFWVSGFLFGKFGRMNLSTGWQIIKKRIRSLIVPFLFVGLIFHFTTGEPLTKYWFLRTLFIVTSINVFYQIVKSKLKLGIVSDSFFYAVSFALLFVMGRLLRGSFVDQVVDFGHFATFNYLAFCLGIMVRRYENLRIFFEHNWTYSICLGLFIVLLFQQIPVPKYIRAFLMCFSGIVCVCYLMKNVFCSGAVVKIIERMGYHSLDIYLIHFFLNISVIEVGDYFLELANGETYYSILSGCMMQLLYGIAASLVICIICLIVAKIFNAGQVWSILLLGKKN